MTEKKNPDYASSAVMLTNSPPVEDLLVKFHTQETQLQFFLDEAQKAIPKETTDMITQINKDLTETNKAIRQAIDEFGSYQDIDKGWYAIKQKRESINYKPSLVKEYAPSKVASFVLIESVDSKAMDAMVKAGQITTLAARQCGEIKESFAYIIR